MKINFTLQDVAQAMIDNSDHSDISDISEDSAFCQYHICVNSDGCLGDGEEFWTYGCIPSSVWDGIDKSSNDAIERFLDNFDNQYETLDNPRFREAAEDLVRQVKNF